MSKQLPENAYTFRTDLDDDYIKRVIDEADPRANFLLVSEQNKFNGDKVLVTLVRTPVTALGAVFPEKKIGPATLEQWLEQASSASPAAVYGDFVGLVTSGDPESVQAAKESIEQDIRHINNLITRRVVQVTVESF